MPDEFVCVIVLYLSVLHTCFRVCTKTILWWEWPKPCPQCHRCWNCSRPLVPQLALWRASRPMSREECARVLGLIQWCSWIFPKGNASNEHTLGDCWKKSGRKSKFLCDLYMQVIVTISEHGLSDTWHSWIMLLLFAVDNIVDTFRSKDLRIRYFSHW